MTITSHTDADMMLQTVTKMTFWNILDNQTTPLAWYEIAELQLYITVIEDDIQLQRLGTVDITKSKAPWRWEENTGAWLFLQWRHLETKRNSGIVSVVLYVAFCLIHS